MGRRRWCRAAAVAAAFLCGVAPAARAAGALAIGVELETTAIDPHFQNTTGNYTITRQIFEPMVFQDQVQHLIPGLALRWTALSDREWEFRLRPGVTFQDGGAFTADDVVFTLHRAPNVPNSPNGFALYTRQIDAVTVVDPLTVRIRSNAADPLLPTELSTILVVSSRTADHATTADFNSGDAAIGTGPYRLVAWRKGDRITLRRNPGYWGAAPAWDDVAMRVIPDPGARVAALLSHEVDMIDAVPSALAATVTARPDMTVLETVSSRLIFLQLDAARAISPYVTGAGGQALDANPLRDARVRRALSMAIDRQALVDRVLEGHAVAAGQLLPDGFTGTSPDLPPEPYQPDAARRLLAEAGHGGGFGLTLNTPINRYASDTRLAEAVGQMWSRAGVPTRIDSQPGGLLLTRLQHQDSSAFLWGWASETGEPSGALRALVATPDPARGWGTSNRLRYANPALDAVLASALVTLDPAARDKQFGEAAAIAVHDGGILPLVFLKASWALRRGLAYTVNPMGYSFAFDARPE